ncbi:MAG TPA: hypothetical protein VFQ68_16185 [Streptosporangiaceae bacterium]|nr:hypothetical protein [Streptosporangiaceae bacterium]
MTEQMNQQEVVERTGLGRRRAAGIYGAVVTARSSPRLASTCPPAGRRAARPIWRAGRCWPPHPLQSRWGW